MNSFANELLMPVNLIIQLTIELINNQEKEMKVIKESGTDVVTLCEYGRTHIYPMSQIKEIIYDKILSKVTILFLDGSDVEFTLVTKLEY